MNSSNQSLISEATVIWISNYTIEEFAPFYQAHNRINEVYWYLNDLRNQFEKIERGQYLNDWAETIRVRKQYVDKRIATTQCPHRTANELRHILDLERAHVRDLSDSLFTHQAERLELAKFGTTLPYGEPLLELVDKETRLARILSQLCDDDDPSVRLNRGFIKLYELLPKLSSMDPRLSPYSEVSKVLEVKQMIESMAADFTMEEQFIDDWFAALKQRVYLSSTAYDLRDVWDWQSFSCFITKVLVKQVARYPKACHLQLMQLEDDAHIAQGEDRRLRGDRFGFERVIERIASSVEGLMFRLTSHHDRSLLPQYDPKWETRWGRKKTREELEIEYKKIDAAFEIPWDEGGLGVNVKNDS